jgi:PAS domain S-box-containing protein
LAGLAIERAQAETALRESEFRWKFALEGAGDGLWDWNVSGKSVLFTARWKEIFGYAETELNTSVDEWSSRVHPDDLARVMADVHAHFDGLTPVYRNEHRGRHKDGTWRWVLARGLVVARDAGGRPLRMIGTTADITARKQAEAEHRDFERKMLDTQKLESLGVLAGGIAHDFNNILTGILGQVSLARLALPAGASTHENLDSIQLRSLRAADLCKQMLAYSGQGQFVVQKHSLNRLVEETTHLLNLSISKKAGLRFNLHPTPPVIRADATQIRQVIMNLVINASEAIGDTSGVITVSTGLVQLEGGELDTKIAGLTLTAGPYASLEITDTGTGMSPATQAKIFDPFFSTKSTGRGLGLAAVLGIIRGHLGDIRLHSSPGRGTTFQVLLPCLPDEFEDTVAPVSVARSPKPDCGCILVADDEEFVREPLAAFLKIRGYEVVTASSGQGAVDAYRAEPDRFALVLMDLSMPELDGAQAFTQMRSLRLAVQVVLMSGFDQREVSLRFKDGRPAGFIQKPFQPDDVIKVIDDILARPPVP